MFVLLGKLAGEKFVRFIGPKRRPLSTMCRVQQGNGRAVKSVKGVPIDVTNSFTR